MGPVQICNLALLEVGSRVLLNSFSDTSPQAVAANAFYTPKTQTLLRAANWDFARAQASLTVWKAAVINGVSSANPPPQPWLYSYLYPADCLKGRFIMPQVPVQPPGTPLTTTPNGVAWIPPVSTSTPFVPGTDFDQSGNPIKVILTNLPNAQLCYTRDLSQFPDLWDSLFQSAETAFLGAYFINALARNAAQYTQQVQSAQSLIAQARMANGNEGINNVDHTPDWLRARFVSGYSWGYNGGAPGVYGGAGWDSLSFPCGLSY